MIALEEARACMIAHARTLETERVDLGNALYRILAEDVHADRDMPPFNKSAMDGYACRRADLAQVLSVIETVKAGQMPRHAVGPGECAKIMTGAPIPDGADCVVMVEHSECPSEGTVRVRTTASHGNICLRGEDMKAGEVVLRQGGRIAPQHIAVLASVGCVRPLVSRRVRVGVIATGDELTAPEAQPGPSQIRNSNSHQLCGQAASMGAIPRYYGIVLDTEAAIGEALRAGLGENDVVLISGGVSMGDFDFVPDAMRKNQVEILFDRIAVKPGKPTTFGVAPHGYCVGLPGNPVSTFVQFELLVKPFLYKLMGHDIRVPFLPFRLAREVARKKTGREAWIPVCITPDSEVEAVDYHGSAHAHALCGADGLLKIPAGVSRLEKGAWVRVRPI